MHRHPKGNLRGRSAAGAAGLVLFLAACAGSPRVAAPGGFGAGSSSILTNAVPATSTPAAAEAKAAPAAAERSALGSAVPAAAKADTGAPASGPGQAAATAGPERDLAAVEADLRQRLAGADPVGPALELGALLAELERHTDAVAVLQEARRRLPDPRLAIAVAYMQRDLGQRHLAVAELRSVRREHGALSLHPGVLRDLAELEWLEGDRDAADATLQELRRVHADDPWVAEHVDALQALGNDMTRNPAPTRIAERDLLGNLRGAPLPAVRLATLDALIERTRRAERSDRQREFERRLLAIAGGDESPALRARAVQLGPPAGDDARGFCEAALADAAPLVRQIAAARSCELLGADAAPLLQRALDSEVDAPSRARLGAELERCRAMAGAGQKERP